jgi:hypothetical protein
VSVDIDADPGEHPTIRQMASKGKKKHASMNRDSLLGSVSVEETDEVEHPPDVWGTVVELKRNDDSYPSSPRLTANTTARSGEDEEMKKYRSPPWVEHKDEFGNPYYVNGDTQESFWPADSRAAHDAALAAAADAAAMKAGLGQSDGNDTNANVWTDPESVVNEEATAAAAAATDGGTAHESMHGHDVNWEFKQGDIVRGNWLQHFDMHGKEYWVHQVSGQSAWDLPVGWEMEPVDSNLWHEVHGGHDSHGHDGYSHGGHAAAFKQGELRCGHWLQHFDGEGKEYWVNQITGASAWELPDGWENDAVIAGAPHVQPPHYLLGATSAGQGAQTYTIEL